MNATYVLNGDGTVNRVGWNIQNGVIMNGSEPFYDNWELSLNYKWENNSWIKYKDEAFDYDPIIIIDEPISNAPPYPSITRKAYVKNLDLNLLENIINLIIIIRHRNAQNKPLLEYDQVITFHINNGFQLTDEITGQPTGGFDLFYLKITRDGMNIPQVCRYFIGKADDIGYIDKLIIAY